LLDPRHMIPESSLREEDVSRFTCTNK
jgi:hypothetical protein